MAKYKKTIGASLCRHNDQFIIIMGREVFKINEVGARIFELCNENYDEQKIIRKLSRFYNADEKVIKKDVSNFINEMLIMKVIKTISK